MGFARFAWIAVLACGAAAAYGVYSPEAADRWVPAAGGLAHQLHDRIWTPPSQTASAPGQQAQPTGPAPIVVTATPVKRADFPVVLQSIGQVQAYNTVLVRARVDGQIMKIAFNEGQMVKQGDLLAQIDPRPFQAALDQAVAKKAQDEANLANAKLDLTRYSTLAKQDFATKQQLDTQNALVLQLTASIAADAAAIDAARTQLDYTTIRAPISGRAGFRLIDEGNLVNAGQQTGIVSIAQLQPIAVIFAEPQEYVTPHQRGAGLRLARSHGHGRGWPQACDRAPVDQRQPGRSPHRDDPAQGRVRQQGQCPLARVRGDDGVAARSGEGRLDCPQRKWCNMAKRGSTSSSSTIRTARRCVR